MQWLEHLKDLVPAQLLEQAKEELSKGGDVVEFLLSRKVSQENILMALSLHYNLPSISLSEYQPDINLFDKINEETARRLHILPLFQLKRRIFIALVDPTDLTVFDFVRQKTGLTAEPVIALKSDIEKAINLHYLMGGKSVFVEPEVKKEYPSPDIKTEVEDESAPVIKAVNHIISSAIRLGASDIHLEPFETRLSLRYRVDGVLHEFPSPSPSIARALVSRIKIISSMDIAERRLPQDGRSSFNLEGKEYDLRVSIIPNMFGESVVMRILDKLGSGKDLEDVGFSQKMLDKFTSMITRPYGIVLVTGPTGSGKSTTLYSVLKKIRSPEKKIITIEDPVEYQMDGITQFSVQSDIGFTFARGLRAFLRHDPDVILVGEIRDRESAEIAIRASLTGHLLFSTLHTNDSVSAPIRLIDMGVQSYMVMSSLIGVLAQRLVRLLCPRCKTPRQPGEKLLESLQIKNIPPVINTFQPVGCPECHQLGYRGRMAVFELLEIMPEMRRLPQELMIPDNIRQIAEKYGFVSLRDDAINKWLSGLTSLQEVINITVD